jgi:hypothetical protein
VQERHARGPGPGLHRSPPLSDDVERTLLVVARCTVKEIADKWKQAASRLGGEPARVVPLKGSAKSLFEDSKITKIILEQMPKAPDSPF